MDINSEHRDEIIFSYIEGLMDDKEKAAFEALLQKDATLHEAVSVFKRTSFVVAEPLSNFEDLSQELIKPNFSMKWIWLSLTGLMMVIGGVYAIYLFKNQSINSVKSNSVSSTDSISMVEKPKDSLPIESVTTLELAKNRKGLDLVKSKHKSNEIQIDTTEKHVSTANPPVEAPVKNSAVQKVEDKNIPVTDTLTLPEGLKEKSVPVKDTVQPKKDAPLAPKVQKLKTIKKLNIKGTEDIKTNSSLY